MVALAALASACSSTPADSLEPLELRAELDFDFRASLAGPDAAWATVLEGAADQHQALTDPEAGPPASLSGPTDETHFVPLLSDIFAQEQAAEAEEKVAQEPDPPAQTPYFDVACTSFALNVDEAKANLGWEASTPWAVVVDLDVIEARLDRLREVLPDSEQESPRLLLEEGKSGTLSVINQHAYLRDFHFERLAASVLADPGIGILGEGLSLNVLASKGPEAEVALEVDLALAERQSPIPQTEFRLPMGSPVTIQQPLILAQRLRTSCALGRDEALLLVTLGRENSSELLFTILTARAYAP